MSIAYATMARTTTRTTRTARSNATSVKPQRLSLGTAWSTSNEDFYAGKLQDASGQYQNQAEFLSMLPQCPEGFHWEVKLFLRQVDTKRGETVVVDVVVEQTEDYVR